MCTSPS
ncbi:hypothetical protein N499_0732B, partial [Wolbachia pipientis wVitA]